MQTLLKTGMASALCASLAFTMAPSVSVAGVMSVPDRTILGLSSPVEQVHYRYYRHHHYRYYHHHHWRHHHYRYWRHRHRYYRYGYDPGAALFGAAALGLLAAGTYGAAYNYPYYGYGWGYPAWGWGGPGYWGGGWGFKRHWGGWGGGWGRPGWGGGFHRGWGGGGFHRGFAGGFHGGPGHFGGGFHKR